MSLVKRNAKTALAWKVANSLKTVHDFLKDTGISSLEESKVQEHFSLIASKFDHTITKECIEGRKTFALQSQGNTVGRIAYVLDELSNEVVNLILLK